MKAFLTGGKQKSILLIMAICVLAVFPYVKTGYIVRFMTTLFMYAALSQIWNILGGFAGYISLGLVGFVGIGAYGTGIIMAVGLNMYVAILLSGLIAALVAMIVGMPILRLRAGYYSIATYAVSFILWQLSNNLIWLTGGGMGFRFKIANAGIDRINAYYYLNMLGIVIIISILCMIISKSSLGYGLMAIKEDEDAANVLGINTTVFKVVAFTISGFFAAIVGGIYGNWLTFIDPASAFDSNLSVMVIIMAMVGAVGTVAGPLLGAVLISIISEVLWNNFLFVHQMFLGVILILIVIFLPKGIMDIFMHREEKLSPRSLARILGENISKFRV